MPKDVGTYLAEQQKKSSGDVATEWGQLEELYNKKYCSDSFTLRVPLFSGHTKPVESDSAKQRRFKQITLILSFYQGFSRSD